jgi:hypothetical protein
LDTDEQTLDRFITKLNEKAKSIAEKEESGDDERAMIAMRSGNKRGRGNMRRPPPGRFQPTVPQMNLNPQPKQWNHPPGRNSNQQVANNNRRPQPPKTNRFQRTSGNRPSNTQRPNTNLDKVECYYCKQLGHYKSECPKLKERLTQGPPNRGYNFSHNAKMAIVDEDTSSHLLNLADSTWNIDSCCSAHMTSNRHWIVNYKTFDTPVRVRLGDNWIVLALGSGLIRTTFGPLRDVLYVPDLGSNLFSVSRATEDNLEFRVTAKGMMIFRGGRFVSRALKDNGVYWLNLEIIQANEQANAALTIDHWHKRLAHMPKELVIKMMKDKIVDGIRIINDKLDDCVDCKLNKCQRASHPLRSNTLVSKPGQSLHFDVIGPNKPDGFSGERFILVMKDEFSTYRMTDCLKAKGKVPEAVKLMVTKSELQTGNNVLKITTDNGSEFLSERLVLFIEHKGIDHVKSAPYVPQQNGRIERENRFLLDQTRTLLNGARLKQELWPEAVSTATYISNRSITHNKEKTPYELWFGKKPNIKNLKIFGQHASVLKQDHLRSKFEPKGSLMYFVGYTDSFNTFRFYDPISNKIVVSCDALFIDQFGPIDPNSQYVHAHLESIPINTDDFENEKIDFTNTIQTPSKGDHDDSSGNEMNDPNQSNAEKDQDKSLYLDASNHSLSNPQENWSSSPNKSIGSTREPEPPSFMFQTRPNTFGNRLFDQGKGIEMRPSISESTISSDVDTREVASPTAPAVATDDSLYQASSIYSQMPTISEELPEVERPSERTQTQSEAQTPKEPSSAPLRRSHRLADSNKRDYNKLAKGMEDLRYAKIACTVEPPKTFAEIMHRNDSADWLQAAQLEINQMIKLRVFELVPRPRQNVVSCRWVFTYKTMPDGSVKPKARLVARGFTQEYGIDYYATFSPVAQMDCLRFLFALAAIRRLFMTQCDVRTAFLYGHLSETIFMEQPEGFNDGTDRVWHLLKSIYGLKQAPRCWGERFSNSLKSLGLIATATDSCIFYKLKPFTIIAIYVDDAIVLSETEDSAFSVIRKLQKEFDINIIKSSKFLGFQYIIHKNGDISLHQHDYLSSVLERFKMNDANPVCTPIALGQKVEDDRPFEDNTKFREIIGALQYAACQTRPDIAYAVGLVSRRVTKPTQTDFLILKRILRYIKGTLDLGITYKAGNLPELITYSDSDFAGDIKTYRSTSGCVILFAGAPISWKSKLQPNVTTSTTEAEYVAVEAAIKNTLCIRALGGELGVISDAPTPVLCDNKGAVLITSNETSVQRTRHMGAKLHFSREQHQSGNVDVQHVQASDQLADMFTKALTTERFVNNRNRLLVKLNLFISCLMVMICVQMTFGQFLITSTPDSLEVEASKYFATNKVPVYHESGQLWTDLYPFQTEPEPEEFLPSSTEKTKRRKKIRVDDSDSNKISLDSLPALDKPTKIHIPGFERVKDESGSDVVKFKRVRPKEIRNTTLVFPTFHYVEIGRIGIQLRNRIKDFCLPYRIAVANTSNPKITIEISRKLLVNCESEQIRIVDTVVNRFRMFNFNRKERKDRKGRKENKREKRHTITMVTGQENTTLPSVEISNINVTDVMIDPIENGKPLEKGQIGDLLLEAMWRSTVDYLKSLVQSSPNVTQVREKRHTQETMDRGKMNNSTNDSEKNDGLTSLLLTIAKVLPGPPYKDLLISQLESSLVGNKKDAMKNENSQLRAENSSDSSKKIQEIGGLVLNTVKQIPGPPFTDSLVSQLNSTILRIKRSTMNNEQDRMKVINSTVISKKNEELMSFLWTLIKTIPGPPFKDLLLSQLESTLVGDNKDIMRNDSIQMKTENSSDIFKKSNELNELVLNIAKAIPSAPFKDLIMSQLNSTVSRTKRDTVRSENDHLISENSTAISSNDEKLTSFLLTVLKVLPGPPFKDLLISYLDSTLLGDKKTGVNVGNSTENLKKTNISIDSGLNVAQILPGPPFKNLLLSQLNKTLMRKERNDMDFEIEADQNYDAAPEVRINETSLNQFKLKRESGETIWEQSNTALEKYVPKHVQVIEETEKPMSGWLYWTQAVTLWALQPIGDRLDPNSSYNLPFVNQEFIKALQIQSNIHSDAIAQSNDALRQTQLAIKNITTAIELKHKLINEIVDNLPTIMQMMSYITIAIQRYADLLDAVYQDMKRGYLNIPAAQKLGWINEDDYYQTTEDTSVMGIFVRNRTIVINLSLSKRDEDITVYNIYPFKQWTDNFQYLKYNGPEFMMFNISSNCSRFIDKPQTLRITEQCLEANQSISLDSGAVWTKEDIEDKVRVLEELREVQTHMS